MDQDWTEYGSKTKVGHIFKAKLEGKNVGLTNEGRDEIAEHLWGARNTVDANQYGTPIKA